MMFLGTYKHMIDDKNRLSLPSKFVSKLPKNIYLSIGFDGCLELRTPEEFEKRYETLSKYSENKKDARNAARIYFASSHGVEVDSAKRILIPAELATAALLTKNVVIIGVGNKIEIWDENKYQKFVKQTAPLYEAIVERLDDQNKE